MRHGLVASLLILMLLSPGIGREPEPRNPAPVSARAASAKVIAGHEPAAKMAQEAMARVKTDGVPGFIDVAFSGKSGSLKKEDRTSTESLFRRLHDSVVVRHGKSLGEIELVRTDVVGQSLVRFVYIEKLERAAIIWHLSFYRGDSGEWRWVGFNMSDRLDNDFRVVKEDAADKDAVAMAREAIDQLKTGGVEKLFDETLDPDKTVIMADRLSSEATFTKIRETTISQVGKALGEFELIRTETIGPSVVRFVYLEKYQGGALVWRLSLYRGAREWKWRDLNVHGYQDEFTAKP